MEIWTQRLLEISIRKFPREKDQYLTYFIKFGGLLPNRYVLITGISIHSKKRGPV